MSLPSKNGLFNTRPATVLDAMDFAGGRAFLRKVLVYQVRHTDATLVLTDETHLALAMLYRHRAKRVEYAMFVKPEAQRHMVGLVRLAQLTLSKLAQDGILVFAHVRSCDVRAQRMASLTGFVPGRMRDASIWFFRGV
jgi:hypothetical protein